jgi:hypothetical protein
VLNEGVFPLIPSVYVDNSLLTAVLLGVLILFFLGERFGWPQSGLVVPGYLAGILVVAPEVALIIGIEALATYFLARALITGLPKFFLIDRAFGRDRFFLILIISIALRIFVEAGPGAPWLEDLGLGTSNPLHSVGLVLVPLTANALWMPGFVRGVPIVLLPVFAVFLLLNHVLLPFTNLNLSHFAFSVESVSQDFLSAPHNYIILLVGCAIAARMNLRFGWEFGGILVPGLLAIAWASPVKVAATFAEVAVTVVLFQWALLFRPFRRINLSGLRPLVLAFGLAYCLKLVLSWWLGEALPGFRAHELFGFGYLLPALLAVRCWKRGSIGRILVPTAAASLLAFFIGSGLSWALSGNPQGDTPDLTQSTTQRHRPAWETMVRGNVGRHAQDPFPEGLLEAGLDAALIGRSVFGHGLRVDAHPDGLIMHGGTRLAFGRLWLRKQAQNTFALSFPDAGAHPGLAEAGVALTKLLDCQALALTPAPQLETLLNSRLGAIRVHAAKQSRLVITGTLPANFDIKALHSTVPNLAVDWQEGPDSIVRLELAPDAILELALRHFHAPIEEGRLLLQETQIRPEQPDSLTVSQLGDIDRGVMRPLLEAQQGSPEWAKLAAWHAKQLGLQLMVDEEVYSLGTSPLKAPPQWTLWLRKGGGDTAIEVPSAGRHFRTLRAGRTWWEATQATALLVHNAKADTDTYTLQRQGVFAAEAIILRRLALYTPGLKVFSASAFFQYENPGVDAILSDGRPALDGMSLPPAFVTLQNLIARGGGNSRRFAARSTSLRFHDSQNDRRRAVELAGGTYIKAYLSPTYRLAMGPLTDSPSLQAALGSAEMPMALQPFSDTWQDDSLSNEALIDEFGALLESLHRYGRTGHPGELDRLQSLGRRKGYGLTIWSESEEALPYLHAQRGAAHLLAPLCNFDMTRSVDKNKAANLEALRESGQAFAWRTQ